MGSQHLEFLLKNDLMELNPSKILREAYAQATLDASLKRLQQELQDIREKKQRDDTVDDPSEQMILSKTSGKIIAEQLEVPALEVEIERAIWQVERALSSKRELLEEKREIELSQKSNR